MSEHTLTSGDKIKDEVKADGTETTTITFSDGGGSDVIVTSTDADIARVAGEVKSGGQLSSPNAAVTVEYDGDNTITALSYEVTKP